ncbi:MAG: nicotinate-nucleotide adenylyltransferase [Halieaceae bacterium]|jgi:nicotinate-nucleotide adenylyltransferase
MIAVSDTRSRAIFGGTFDPVHIGHMRTAIDARRQLLVDTLYLMPCHIPVHRDEPGCTAEQRRDMLELAIAGNTGLALDDRELRRGAPSYSLDSIVEIRGEVGPDAPVFLLLGSDSFASFDQWYRWDELIELCHLVVVERLGVPAIYSQPVRELLRSRQVDSVESMHESAGGLILSLILTPWQVSATAVREAIDRGESTRYLLPDAVLRYISDNQLYNYGNLPK